MACPARPDERWFRCAWERLGLWVRSRVRAALSSGLLGRRVTPGVPASHEQRGRVVEEWKGCDHAARAPAASHKTGTDAPERLAAGVARLDIVRWATRRREVVQAQCRTHAPVSGLPTCSPRRRSQLRSRSRGTVRYRYRYRYRCRRLGSPFTGRVRRTRRHET